MTRSMLVSSIVFGVFLKIENFDILANGFPKQKKIQGSLILCHKICGQLQCSQTAPKGGGGDNRSCRKKHKVKRRRRDKIEAAAGQGEKSTSITEKSSVNA